MATPPNARARRGNASRYCCGSGHAHRQGGSLLKAKVNAARQRSASAATAARMDGSDMILRAFFPVEYHIVVSYRRSSIRSASSLLPTRCTTCPTVLPILLASLTRYRRSVFSLPLPVTYMPEQHRLKSPKPIPIYIKMCRHPKPSYRLNTH